MEFFILNKLKPKIIDLYLLTEIISPFLGGLVFFLFIFLMFQFIRLTEFFVVHGVSALILGKLTSLMLLSFLPSVLPIAFLISILIAFGRLSIDSELVALKASGVSVFRMTLPVVIFAFFISAAVLVLNLDLVPKGERLFKSTLTRVSNTKVVSSIQPGAFTSGFFDLLVFAEQFDFKTNHLKNIFLYDDRESKTPVVVIAREGEILSLKPSTELGSSALLKLFSGNIHRNNLEEQSYQKVDFHEYQLFLEVKEGGGTAEIKTKMIPYQELLQIIRTTPKDAYIHLEYVAEMWRRIALGIAPLIFVFLGIGFGTIKTRAVKTS
ncbi:MAG: LptF/LptG family permease, partial [Bdellovibrio sp.]|nr:LptF/LptG family permease [Bdellovibrio sp.]